MPVVVIVEDELTLIQVLEAARETADGGEG